MLQPAVVPVVKILITIALFCAGILWLALLDKN
jgi:hypothetical protein